MRLMSIVEVRADLERLPAESRAAAFQWMAAVWDDGFGVGAGRLPRKNPFLPPAATKAKGKAR